MNKSFVVITINILLIMVIISCGISTSGISADQQATLVAFSIYSTITAEAHKFTPTIPQATDTPTLPPTPIPTETVAPTETVLPTPSQVLLIDWNKEIWDFGENKDCYEPDVACWRVINISSFSSLTSKTPIYIDPNWSNPQLILWNKYKTTKTTQGEYAWIRVERAVYAVEIKIQGEPQWERLISNMGTKDYWHKISIDLMEYSGEEIVIRIVGEPNQCAYTWYIANVSIEPNLPSP